MPKGYSKLTGKPNSGSFYKGMPPTKGCFKKGHSNSKAEKNANWMGGISLNYIKAHPSRPKTEQCEVCGAVGKLVFDHNHKDNKFRGWVCYRCNIALGMVQDRVEILELLIQYIKNNGI